MKTLGNTTASQAKDNVKDIEFWGTNDLFKLVSKASSQKEGWMKSTKAMEITGVGCLVQISTQQGSHIAEALQFIPNVCIIEKWDENKKVIARKIASTILCNNLKESTEGCWYNLKGELLKQKNYNGYTGPKMGS